MAHSDLANEIPPYLGGQYNSLEPWALLEHIQEDKMQQTNSSCVESMDQLYETCYEYTPESEGDNDVDKENSTIPETAMHCNQMCLENPAPQSARTGLEAEEHEEEKETSRESTSRPLESLQIVTKSHRKLQSELERTKRELEDCRKRLKEEEQRAKTYQRKALIYKAHIMHMRKLHGIKPTPL